MPNPETHTCQCGYTWKHGAHGGHQCSTYYQATIAKQLDALKEISNMCISEMTMNISLDANAIGEVIYAATGLSNPKLNEPPIEDHRYQPLQLVRGNVIRNTSLNRLIVIREARERHINEEFVSDRPHEDEDYSYLCNNDYCRCHQ